MAVPTDEYDGDGRRQSGGRREDDFSPQQRKILKRLADKEAFWDEFRQRMAAKSKAWAWVATVITAVIGAWAALKGLGIGVTFGTSGE